MLDKIMRFFEVHVCAVLFTLMSSIIMIQIICRAFGMPLAWTEETARYMFVWIIYLASSKAVRDSKHLSVEILPMLLKGRARKALDCFSNLIVLVFFLVLCYFGMLVLRGMVQNPQYSAATGTNMMIPYAAPTVGSLFMIIRAVQNCIDNVKGLVGKEENAKGGELL